METLEIIFEGTDLAWYVYKVALVRLWMILAGGGVGYWLALPAILLLDAPDKSITW